MAFALRAHVKCVHFCLPCKNVGKQRNEQFFGGGGKNRLLRRAHPARSCVGSPPLADTDILSAFQPPAALAPLRFPISTQTKNAGGIEPII